MNEAIAAKLNQLRRIGTLLVVLGIIACGLGAVQNPRQFFISYLMGYAFWLGLSLGCLGVAMMHHLTGGRWGFVTRRFLEAGFMTLPLMTLLFVPLLFGLADLYPWARAGATEAVLRGRGAYLNAPCFCARAVFCFVVWIVMALCLRRWSLQQDATPDPARTIRMRTLSGPGIVIYPVTATFAFIDWVMSAESDWYSTMFPVIVLIGQILSAFAFITLLLAWFHSDSPFRGMVSRVHFHDLGNLLLAFVIFWTYVTFGQFLIIYSGNLPHEINWYLHRIAGGWKYIIWLLALFHFFVPFFLLLFRVMKQNVRRLAVIAALVFVMHILESFWVIEPAWFPTGLHVHWLDFATVLALGGAWLAVFAGNLGRHPLLARNDPRIEPVTSPLAHAK